MKKLIRLYYGFQFFFSLLLWIPIYYEYQKRIGLSDAQIFGIQSVYYTVFCFLEIPTGMLADLWGCRACLRWGAAALVAANLLPVLSPGYWGFLTHFLLIAFSRSLISGASSAYLYEGLLERGADAGAYKEIEGNARAYGLLGKVLLWPLIGPLMEWKLQSPYVLTTLAAGMSVLYALWLPAERPSRAVEAVSPSSRFFADIGPVAAGLARSPLLPLLMAQGLGIFILSRICQTNLFQPILSAKAFAVSSYGFWMAATTVFEALGSAYPLIRWLLRRISELNAVFVLTALLGVCLAVISMTGAAGTVASLMAFSLFTGMSFPIQKQLLNDAISSAGTLARYRATLLSVESIIDRAVCAWVVSCIGTYVATGRIAEFLQISAGFCWIGSGVLWLVMRRVADRLALISPAPASIQTE